jgi:hypothetical protein
MNLKISWGTGIVIAFVIFMGGTISTAVYLMNKNVNLVTEDYYDQEIKYQQQIDRMERTSQLGNKQIVSFDGSIVRINIPKSVLSSRLTGEIYFYRPSDSKSDIKIPLITDTSGVQVIPVERLEKGLWKIKVSWLSKGKDYFSEDRILIQ